MTKNTSPRRGRPELSESDRRSVVVQFRVTEEESRKLAEKASKAGKRTVSDWLRDTALAT